MDVSLRLSSTFSSPLAVSSCSVPADSVESGNNDTFHSSLPSGPRGSRKGSIESSTDFTDAK